MKISLIILACLAAIISLAYYMTGFRSAFEADQQCHYEMSKDYSGNSSIGCDHDLETRQWLLFQEKNNEPSMVIKRFRY